ncbi:unnamed protein product [Adineta steineri]|uniref:WH1 domain-containing protein n=1 Tax=Adineta steineri TaxID=433720 RepID=A0A819RED0_9BILA|nr:unnamed protein product [Adineta steineri]CAF4050791.1 unnamed protein product [Adineta steineri]
MPSETQQQRLIHNPSKNLQPYELKCLFEILGINCVTLATAVAQIFYGYNGTRINSLPGVLCFVKDFDNKKYYFRLYNLKSRQVIYEEVVRKILRLEKETDVFYTFIESNCKIAIEFIDRDEAQTFSHHFHSKQEDRQKKKKTNAITKVAPPNIQPSVSSPDVSAMMNGINPQTSAVIQAQISAVPIPGNTPEQARDAKNQGSLTPDRKNKKNIRPHISAPIQSTLVHVGHIGTNDCFFKDDSQKQLFEDVLSKLGPSVRVSNNPGQQQMISAVPRTPPRAGPRRPDNAYPQIYAPPAPSPSNSGAFITDQSRVHVPPATPPPSPPPRPPRIPSNFINQSQDSGGPALRPSPPAQVLSSGPVTKPVSVPAVRSARNNLFDKIRNFDKSKLKQRTKRSPLPEVTSVGDTSPGVEDTMV